MPKQLYIFSGLGADERVFKNLNLSQYSVCFVNWISPLKNESIEDYAKRLSVLVAIQKPIVLGLSFGGMMAIELAKHVEVEKIILISSAKCQQEIPFYYRLAGFLHLHQVIPAKLLKQSNAVTNWLFGAKQQQDKALLQQILKDTDPVFLKWAITKILQWKNPAPSVETFHIHGTADKVLPLRFIQSDVIIKDGGHLMILDKAEEINLILNTQLSR